VEESARSVRQHKARGVSPGQPQHSPSPRSGRQKSRRLFLRQEHFILSITKLTTTICVTAVAALRGLYILPPRPWGSRPRLYASARFAGWVTQRYYCPPKRGEATHANSNPNFPNSISFSSKSVASALSIASFSLFGSFEFDSIARRSS
jgi:hypothetical protein